MSIPQQVMSMNGQSVADSLIRIRDLEVRFENRETGQEFVALSGIDLDVHEGEFVVIIGKSGCGKTTLLNVLAGLVDPAQGEVSIEGATPRSIRHRVGYMFARDALLPWRSALRNVEYGMELRGVPSGERRRRAKKYLDLVSLGEHRRKWPWQLSQGMRQRVALARTWALEAHLLLLDEPFAAVDAQTREALHLQFLDLWERTRPAVFFVTHDLSEAILLADRILVVASGEIIHEATVPFGRPRSASLLEDDEAALDLRRKLHKLLL